MKKKKEKKKFISKTFTSCLPSYVKKGWLDSLLTESSILTWPRGIRKDTDYIKV